MAHLSSQPLPRKGQEEEEEEKLNLVKLLVQQPYG